MSLAHWSCQKRCPMKSLGRSTISISFTYCLGGEPAWLHHVAPLYHASCKLDLLLLLPVQHSDRWCRGCPVTDSRTPASTLPDLDSRGTRKMYTTSTKAIEGVGQGPGKFTLDVGKAHQQATDLGRKECKYINEMTWSILVVICHFLPTVHCTYL